MPNIIIVGNGWITLTEPLVDLLVSVCDKGLDCQTLLLEKLQHPLKSFLFHVIASTYLIALHISITYKYTC